MARSTASSATSRPGSRPAAATPRPCDVGEEAQAHEPGPLPEGGRLRDRTDERGKARGDDRDGAAGRVAVEVLQADQQGSPVDETCVLELIDEDGQASVLVVAGELAGVLKRGLDHRALA